MYAYNQTIDNTRSLSNTILNNSISEYEELTTNFTKDYYRDDIYYRYKNYLDDRHIHSTSTLIDGEEWDIVVPDDYSTIQEAIDIASPDEGYRIFVRRGNYNENIIISTDRIMLHGQNKETTIIDGNNLGDVIKIDCKYLNISGFTIRNGDSGVYIFQSSGNIIQDNIIKDNDVGIEINNHSHANNITQNQILENTQDGIKISGFCTGNTIINNIISDNTNFGIGVSNVCRTNAVISNEICNNFVGINISGVSDGNYFYSNSLISNNLNAYDNSENNWDNGKIGNHWSDYKGEDNDSDGIGDTPYHIIGGNNQDNYPLMGQPIQAQFLNVDEIKKVSCSMKSYLPNFSYNGRTIYVPDDYPSIQDAINHSNDGDIIYVRAGVYYEHIIVNKQVKIEGEGADYTFVDGLRENNHVFKITSDNVEITGFNISNCSSGFSGIRVNSDDCYIHDNFLTDCGGGVEIWDTVNTVITGNIFFDNIWGIYIHYSSGFTISSNVLEENSYGIEAGFSQGIIRNSSIFRSSLNGILVINLENCLFYNNHISYNDGIGIQLFSSGNNCFSGNMIENNNGDGVSASKSYNNNIINNRINNNIHSGISFGLFLSNTNISGNIITGNDWFGIVAYFLLNSNITGNTITVNNRYGVGLPIFYSSNNNISGNIITTGHNSDNILLFYSSNNIITGNIITGGCFDGISLGFSSNNNINDNIITGNGSSKGINMMYSSNNNITGNTITGQTLDGISLWHAFNNNISGNIIATGNDRYGTGIFMMHLSNNNINKNNFFKNDRHLRFYNSTACNFNSNYWDNWRFHFPKPIFGKIEFGNSNIYIPWLQFDWHPAQEPYDIP